MKPSILGRLLAVAGVAATLGLLASQPAAAYDKLVIFGDSLSDSGNNALAVGTDPGQVITGNSYIPTYPYASGVYSNANVWATSFAAGLGLSALPSLAGGTDYAFGGARTGLVSADGIPSLRNQVADYLAGGGGSGDALYVIAGGGNNARDTLEAIASGAPLAQTLLAGALRYARDVGVMVDQLQAAGAQHIVVWNTPDLALAPAVRAQAGGSFLAGIVVDTMNRALDRRLDRETGVGLFDIFGLMDAVAADPGAYGLVNVSDACGSIVGCDPSTYLFWDGIHPTSAGHAIIANAMLAAVVPEPGSVWLYLAGIGLLVSWRRRSAR